MNPKTWGHDATSCATPFLSETTRVIAFRCDSETNLFQDVDTALGARSVGATGPVGPRVQQYRVLRPNLVRERQRVRPAGLGTKIQERGGKWVCQYGCKWPVAAFAGLVASLHRVGESTGTVQ